MPCPLLPLQLKSIIALRERSFAHHLGFPRQAFLRDRSPESSEPFVELIRGMNSPIQQVNVAIISIELDCVSIIFLLQYPTAQRTRPQEYWVSSILEIFHHL